MASIETLATFFGWCSIVHVGLLSLMLLLVVPFGEAFGRLNAKIFGVTEAEAKAIFFHVFQQYRLAVVVLNLVPYVALKIMG